eukprot:1728489-Rhodomonas_salina.2
MSHGNAAAGRCDDPVRRSRLGLGEEEGQTSVRWRELASVDSEMNISGPYQAGTQTQEFDAPVSESLACCHVICAAMHARCARGGAALREA